MKKYKNQTPTDLHPAAKPSRLSRFLDAIPRVMSSKLSIFIYIFLFVYLVVYALICLVVPALLSFVPGDNVQLVLGNYTNILSALGASIAAGSAAVIHGKVTTLRDSHEDFRNSTRADHDRMQRTIDELHAKIDRLTGELSKTPPTTPR